ncbi:hypothetical protein [Desulfovibrio litoralis]|uniref:Uncharacterized protein n=1 Tax=Desulfovibrio litoralis DSM 11393 TaxID=1121455 RepID=A0A1M7T5F5_9BACT|nr:hypothetical protein [Desulfovibrio litoralis]SHN65951.1 hypothetical protein SAMN02745728_01557 [Desulfovibrio litoralis DSM 11393]
MEIQNNTVNSIQATLVNHPKNIENSKADEKLSIETKTEDNVALGFNAEEMKSAHTLNEEIVARLLGLI